jgi:choline dehydrogenase-like flavoprotein
MASEQYEYDAVIVGAGVMGALVAKKLTEAGKKVLILEAGRASGLSFASYQSYVETYRKAEIKDTNSPYVQNAMAPSPYERDIAKSSERTPDLNGYQVQKGPLPFGSTYLRSLGGTTLHWLGTCPRMLPSDFRLHSLYGVGRDWPIDYDEIAPYYCEAEWAIGVSANKEDQSYFGVHFPEDYDYPMERIPLSWSDLQIAAAVDGSTLRLGSQDYPVWVESLPQARNAIPRKGYTPQGAVGAEHLGQRCEGNASCIPICPVQAKYSALKTLSRLNPARATLRTQAVATALKLGADGRIAGIEVAQYADEAGALPVHRGTVRGRLYVLAAHAVENAKLLLASKAANRSDQVGRNLMDHPFFITWALAPKNLGMFRGPGQTAGIPRFATAPSGATSPPCASTWATGAGTWPPTRRPATWCRASARACTAARCAASWPTSCRVSCASASTSSSCQKAATASPSARSSWGRWAATARCCTTTSATTPSAPCWRPPRSPTMSTAAWASSRRTSCRTTSPAIPATRRSSTRARRSGCPSSAPATTWARTAWAARPRTRSPTSTRAPGTTTTSTSSAAAAWSPAAAPTRP